MTSNSFKIHRMYHISPFVIESIVLIWCFCFRFGTGPGFHRVMALRSNLSCHRYHCLIICRSKIQLANYPVTHTDSRPPFGIIIYIIPEFEETYVRNTIEYLVHLILPSPPRLGLLLSPLPQGASNAGFAGPRTGAGWVFLICGWFS